MAGIALGAVAVVAVAIAISSGGGGKSLQTGSKASATVANVEQLLAGIPQSGAILGNRSAPVTITYYGDLQCPVCRDFTLDGGFPQLVANEVRSGKVKVVYSAMQTATRDAGTFRTQQVAALAAGMQNRFWNYVELFYRQQGQEGSGYVTGSYLMGLAKQVPGLDLGQWQAARSDSSLAGQLQLEQQAAMAKGIGATPTLVLQGPKGKATPPAGVLTYPELQSAIQQVS